MMMMTVCFPTYMYMVSTFSSQIFYSIVTSDSNNFDLDKSTGLITSKTTFHRMDNPTYQLTLSANDSSNIG